MKLFLLSTLVGLSFAANCPAGYFSKGTDVCNFACSDGCLGEDNACDDTGKCTDTSGCNEFWTSPKTPGKGEVAGMCNRPQCFGDEGCAEGGECIAPNHCICGKSGAQVVAKRVTWTTTKGEAKDIEGYNCVSLRKDGIIGAFIALCVMTISITICGGIERHRNKGKSKFAM